MVATDDMAERSNAWNASMRFLDFTICAWREGSYLQVLAHSTPAGGMRQPVPVKLTDFNPDDYRLRAGAPLSRGADLGRQLARLILPDGVWALLGQALRIIASNPELGLRIRLCLDEELIDLPWEFLYRRDVDAATALSGFLLMDGRISLVREAPSVYQTELPSDHQRSGVFVGAFFNDGSDSRGVEAECQSLVRALEPVRALMSMSFARADSSAAIDALLAAGCDVFHYAGHVDIDLATGVERIVQLVQRTATGVTDAMPVPASWTSGDELAGRLARAGTRLSIFNACNSGFWPFIRPFIRAGIPAVVGIQGSVAQRPAVTFAEILYRSLAVGLSLDEAFTSARLAVVNPERSCDECDWGRFMAYMPTDAAVLFPRTAAAGIERCQREVRAERDQTLRAVTALAEKIDGADVSRMLSDIAERSVLILGRFSEGRKVVLDAIKTALNNSTHGYIPILFDFEKPGDRDLIESILRFAAVSRFVVADLSGPRSVPAELQAIVPQFPSLPVVPIMDVSEREYPVSDNILRRSSVLRPVVQYRDLAHLVEILDSQVLAPAEALFKTLKATR